MEGGGTVLGKVVRDPHLRAGNDGLMEIDEVRELTGRESKEGWKAGLGK